MNEYFKKGDKVIFDMSNNYSKYINVNNFSAINIIDDIEYHVYFSLLHFKGIQGWFNSELFKYDKKTERRDKLKNIIYEGLGY